MTDLPNLAICLVTYKRTAEALRTIQGIVDNLQYPLEKRSWFVNDDGSPPEHAQAIRDLLREKGEQLLWMNTVRTSGGTFNAGKGWNACLGNAHQHSDFVLWLEDDWVLESKLEMERHVQLLAEREDIGIVSYRGLTEGSDITITTHAGYHYFKYLRSCMNAYSGNPHLRHARFVRTYGWFAEDRNPGDMEINYDWRFCHKTGCDIWRPAGDNPWGIFGHIGTVQTFIGNRTPR